MDGPPWARGYRHTSGAASYCDIPCVRALVQGLMGFLLTAANACLRPLAPPSRFAAAASGIPSHIREWVAVGKVAVRADERAVKVINREWGLDAVHTQLMLPHLLWDLDLHHAKHLKGRAL
jgi:hypothetical protein